MSVNMTKVKKESFRDLSAPVAGYESPNEKSQESLWPKTSSLNFAHLVAGMEPGMREKLINLCDRRIEGLFKEMEDHLTSSLHCISILHHEAEAAAQMAKIRYYKDIASLLEAAGRVESNLSE